MREEEAPHTTVTECCDATSEIPQHSEQGRREGPNEEFPIWESPLGDARPPGCGGLKDLWASTRGEGHLTRAAARKGGMLQTVKRKGEKFHARMHVHVALPVHAVL